MLCGLDFDPLVDAHKMTRSQERYAQNMFGLEWFRPARERRMLITISAGDIIMMFFFSFLGLFREGELLNALMMTTAKIGRHGMTEKKKRRREKVHGFRGQHLLLECEIGSDKMVARVFGSMKSHTHIIGVVEDSIVQRYSSVAKCSTL